MKKKLNKNGIDQVISYLGEDKFSGVNVSGVGDLLCGKFTKNDLKRLSNIDVVVEHVGSELHEVFHLMEQENNIEDTVNVSEEAINAVKELMPALQQVFPTRDEINQVLNDFKNQMIDPQEMIKNLESQIESIKNQSRERDEAG